MFRSSGSLLTSFMSSTTPASVRAVRTLRSAAGLNAAPNTSRKGTKRQPSPTESSAQTTSRFSGEMILSSVGMQNETIIAPSVPPAATKGNS